MSSSSPANPTKPMPSTPGKEDSDAELAQEMDVDQDTDADVPNITSRKRVLYGQHPDGKSGPVYCSVIRRAESQNLQIKLAWNPIGRPFSKHTDSKGSFLKNPESILRSIHDNGLEASPFNNRSNYLELAPSADTLILVERIRAVYMSQNELPKMEQYKTPVRKGKPTKTTAKVDKSSVRSGSLDEEGISAGERTEDDIDDGDINDALNEPSTPHSQDNAMSAPQNVDSSYSSALEQLEDNSQYPATFEGNVSSAPLGTSATGQSYDYFLKAHSCKSKEDLLKLEHSLTLELSVVRQLADPDNAAWRSNSPGDAGIPEQLEGQHDETAPIKRDSAEAFHHWYDTYRSKPNEELRLLREELDDECSQKIQAIDSLLDNVYWG